MVTEVAMARSAENRPGGGRLDDEWDDTPSIEELAAEQGVKPVARFEDLLGDFWPDDEDVDDFIAAVRRWRQHGVAGDCRSWRRSS